MDGIRTVEDERTAVLHVSLDSFEVRIGREGVRRLCSVPIYASDSGRPGVSQESLDGCLTDLGGSRDDGDELLVDRLHLCVFLNDTLICCYNDL